MCPRFEPWRGSFRDAQRINTGSLSVFSCPEADEWEVAVSLPSPLPSLYADLIKVFSLVFLWCAENPIWQIAKSSCLIFSPKCRIPASIEREANRCEEVALRWEA